MNDDIEKLIEILKSSNNIVFFGGAGCSCESGIPDFRSSSGLFSKKMNCNFTPEQAVSHSFFVKHPEEFYEFYKKNLVYLEAKPNDCHLSLTKLEKMKKLKAVVTQNIDGLHQAAGTKEVYELHGSVHRNYCTKCHAFYDASFVVTRKGIPHCEKCGAIIKPDVVLYEEGLDEELIQKTINAISMAETLIIGGTSLVVYPAASFINYFNGKNLILINKSETQADKRANLVIHEEIGKVMKQAVLPLVV
ncbi:MAG: NAD-dependent protein deacylase [Lachnospiraceae bacterium]